MDLNVNLDLPLALRENLRRRPSREPPHGVHGRAEVPRGRLREVGEGLVPAGEPLRLRAAADLRRREGAGTQIHTVNRSS